MAAEVKKKNANIGRRWKLALYFVVLLITLFPLFCPYIMEGERIQEWLVRIQQPRLYLRAEELADAGIQFSALNSGLFCLPFALLYRLLGNLVMTYRLFMLMVQVGTLGTALLLFRRLFPDDEKAVFAGVIFYMTNPYRIAVCYDMADLAQATALMLIPLVIYAAVELWEGVKWKAILIGAAALAGVGYAEGMLFWIVLGCLVLACIFTGNFKALSIVIPALLLFCVGILQTISYLFETDFGQLGITTQTIMSRGYHVGELFLFLHSPEKLPGMGYGLGMAVLSGAWLVFTKSDEEKRKRNRIFVGMSVLLAVLSLKIFPWDLVERVAEVFARLVTFLRTPQIFWGPAQICLCVFSAWSVAQLGRRKEKVLSAVFPIVIFTVCVAMCIWQCNTLTYERLPLVLVE